MASKQFLSQLFDAHAHDLKEFLTDPEELVACPVCLKAYLREATDTGELTDGHVWPKAIRKGSPVASKMHVLLCRECNGKSSPFDQQMQLEELIRRGDESGELYGRRQVSLIIEGEEEPLIVHGLSVTINQDGTGINVSGRMLNDKTWRDGSPKDQARFMELAEKQLRVKFEIDQLEGYKSDRVVPAWVTAAFLMAYHALGYRYILNTRLEPVRNYILRSFDMTGDPQPMPNEETFGIGRYESQSFPDPLLNFVFPLDPTKAVYLQVSYLRTAVRLPMWFVPPVMDEVLRNMHPDLKARLGKMRESGTPVVYPITCSKTEIHTCWFDYLLGKETPTPTTPEHEATAAS